MYLYICIHICPRVPDLTWCKCKPARIVHAGIYMYFPVCICLRYPCIYIVCRSCMCYLYLCNDILVLYKLNKDVCNLVILYNHKTIHFWTVNTVKGGDNIFANYKSNLCVYFIAFSSLIYLQIWKKKLRKIIFDHVRALWKLNRNKEGKIAKNALFLVFLP